MKRAGNREREARDGRVERVSVLGEHLVAAAHGADRRGNHRAAGVFERLARLQQRLLANDAKAFADQVIKTGKVTYGYIGVEMDPEGLSNEKMRDALGLPDTISGVLIRNVTKGKPAEQEDPLSPLNPASSQEMI